MTIKEIEAETARIFREKANAIRKSGVQYLNGQPVNAPRSFTTRSRDNYPTLEDIERKWADVCNDGLHTLSGNKETGRRCKQCERQRKSEKKR